MIACVFEVLGRDPEHLAVACSLISSYKRGLITPRRLAHRIDPVQPGYDHLVSTTVDWSD